MEEEQRLDVVSWSDDGRRKGEGDDEMIWFRGELFSIMDLKCLNCVARAQCCKAGVVGKWGNPNSVSCGWNLAICVNHRLRDVSHVTPNNVWERDSVSGRKFSCLWRDVTGTTLAWCYCVQKPQKSRNWLICVGVYITVGWGGKVKWRWVVWYNGQVWCREGDWWVFSERGSMAAVVIKLWKVMFQSWYRANGSVS